MNSISKLFGDGLRLLLLFSCTLAITGCFDFEEEATEEEDNTVYEAPTLSLDFVSIESGSFTMGSPESELGRLGKSLEEDETQREVTIEKDFQLLKTELSFTDWDAVQKWASQNGYTDLGAQNGYKVEEGDAANYPATMVSWFEAVKWCNALSEAEGLTPCYSRNGQVYKTDKKEDAEIAAEEAVEEAAEGAGEEVAEKDDEIICDFTANGYRLPTDAEWEYACRAGSTTAFYTGEITHKKYKPLDLALDKAGWYYGNSDKKVHPVGSKEANAWGLQDMHGNVWEWCWDIYTTSEEFAGAVEAAEAGEEAEEEKSDAHRVRRGGCFTLNASECRSANRSKAAPGSDPASIGFRIAKNVVAE